MNLKKVFLISLFLLVLSVSVVSAADSNNDVALIHQSVLMILF